MIPTIHPVLHALIGTGEGGDGFGALLVIAIYFALVALGVAMMTLQVITLVWFWRASGQVDAEQGLRVRRAKIFMVVNWVWLGVLAGSGYLLRNEGPLEHMWLFAWYPLAALAAITVLHLMSLHRHAAVSFGLLVGTFFYVQVVVPTVAERVWQQAHQQEIAKILRSEAVANRERFQREEFGQQQLKLRNRQISIWIEETTKSLVSISHLVQSGSAISDEERVKLRIFYIDRIYACHRLRQSLRQIDAHEYQERNEDLKRHIGLILSWDQEPWLTGLAAQQVKGLKADIRAQP